MNKNSKSIQKIFNYFIVAGACYCSILWILLIASLLSILTIESLTGVFFVVLFIILFLPVSLYLRRKNKNHVIKLPKFLTYKTMVVIRKISFIIFLVVFFLFAIAYKGKQISMADFANYGLTVEEYFNYLKWQFAFYVTWITFSFSILAIGPLVVSSDQWRGRITDEF